MLATHDALSNAKTVLGHLMEAIGSSSIGADTVYGELEDQQLRGSALNGLTDAIAEWQAATSADQPSASTHT